MPSKQNQAVVTGIVLITLLLSAYFLAQGSTGLLAHRLFSGTASASAALPGSAHIDVRRETKSNEAIVSRNIFGPDVSLRLVEPSDADLELELGEDGELILPDDGIISRCDGNVRLVAAVVNPKSTAHSVAGLAEGSEKATLYREGMSVGGRTIVAISPHRVILQSSGRLCEVPMWSSDDAPPSRNPSNVAEAIKKATEARASRPTPSDRNAGLSSEEMSSGITKVDDENYQVSRDVFDKLLEDPSALGGLARGIAHEENGQTVGMKLYGIRRTALLGRLGVQNGDMLRTVNGFEVSNMQADADAALNALTALRGSNKVSVSVIRRGKPVTLEYTVK